MEDSLRHNWIWNQHSQQGLMGLKGRKCIEGPVELT